MCGLAVAIGALPDAAHTEAVLGVLRHRGPDASGTRTIDDVFFGHTRLAIIDLSDAASQPMVSDDGRYTLVYNGEIYNYVELRERVAGRGWRLHGSGDTEVLLALLALEGETCLADLRGMFAFVLWDHHERRLLAARDHFGIKPLFYDHTPSRTLLASELRALCLLGSGARLDAAGVESFLLTGSVHGPRTILEGVRTLPPGHLLEIRDGAAAERPYWRLPDEIVEGRSRTEVVGELDEILSESIRIQLRSDVPVGTFLSGGLDSSLVTAYAATHLGEGLHTFSVGFADADRRWDETPAARLVSDRYRTDHHVIVVPRSEFAERMRLIPRAIDQPSADGVNSYFVAGAAASHVKVALSGQGGDELFAGYNIFQFASRVLGMLERLPTPPRRAHRVGVQLLRLPARAQHNWYLRATAALLTRADPALLSRMTHPLFAAREIGAPPRFPPRPRDGSTDVVNAMSRDHITGYLRDTLLRDMDAMSMAHSLEVRVPLVDHIVARFALGIPGNEKVAWGNSKSLLREIAHERLPAALLTRRKQGFAFPLGEWLRHPDCYGQLNEALAPDRIRDAGFVAPEQVRHELARLRRPLPGDIMWLRAQRVWALFVLHEWHAQWTELRRVGAAAAVIAPSR